MFKRLTPAEGIAALNDRLILEAGMLSSSPDHAPDKAFRLGRRERKALARAAELGMITDQAVTTPPGYDLLGEPSQFFLVRTNS